jgi:hypothetical protein
MRAAISVLRRLSKLKTRKLLNDGPVKGTKTILNHEGHEVHEVTNTRKNFVFFVSFVSFLFKRPS